MDINYYDCIHPYITYQKNTCSYCDRLDPLIIYYGSSFYITVAIGAYVPGYIQLCSYEHRTSATGILPSECEEFEILLKAIRNSFMKVYGTYGICFEHGQAGSCLWTENHVNSLCHHMHIHCLPVTVNAHQEISSRFPDFNKVENIYEMIEVRKDILKGGSYLYFSPNPEEQYMYNVTNQDVPRQYLRSCIASLIGIPEKADWIKFPGVEYYESTINLLKKAIEEELQ